MKTPEQLESRRRSRRKWMENNPEAMDKARERWRLFGERVMRHGEQIATRSDLLIWNSLQLTE